MATYRWFADDQTLSQDPLGVGNGWSLVSGVALTTSEIQPITTPIGDRAWYVKTASSQTHRFLFDAVASTASDVELLVLMRRNTSAAGTIFGYPRLDGTGSPYVGMGLDNTSINWRWEVSTSDVSSAHGLTADNVWLWHRIKVVSSTTTYIKTWVPGDLEPGEWEWTRTATVPASGQVGWGGYFATIRDQYLAFFSVGVAEPAPGPEVVRPGFIITGIKEPNASDQLVGATIAVSNARVLVWAGVSPDDTNEAGAVILNQTITGGSMTVDTDNYGAVGDSTIVKVDWDAGGGETKFFRATPTIIDLDA